MIRFSPQCLLTRILGRISNIHLRTLFDSIRNLLMNLNLFKNSPGSTKSVYRQRITTRLFIICLMISLITTSLYTFLSTQIKTIMVPSPSQADYEQLFQLHSDSLQCSCSQFAIPHSDIVRIAPNFHQLCSSRLILPKWYNLLVPVNKSTHTDFRQFEAAFGANYFQILGTFCALANNTVTDAYRAFSTNSLISTRILSEALFSEQVKVLTDAFTTSTHSAFIRIFSLARNATQINQLASRTFSNFQIFFDTNIQVILMGSQPLGLFSPYSPTLHSPCSCISEGNKCAAYTYVYNTSGADDLVFLKNLIVKCLPTESALASTLECWYDQDCFSSVLAAYARTGVSHINDTLPLDLHILSRFASNATLEIMMNELLLENWTTTIFYDQFYRKCAPRSCTYPIEQRFDIFFVIVTVMGIYSGLSQTLRLILPIVVRLFLVFLRCIRLRGYSANQSTSPAKGIQCDGKSGNSAHVLKIFSHKLSKILVLE